MARINVNAGKLDSRLLAGIAQGVQRGEQLDPAKSLMTGFNQGRQMRANELAMQFKQEQLLNEREKMEILKGRREDEVADRETAQIAEEAAKEKQAAFVSGWQKAYAEHDGDVTNPDFQSKIISMAAQLDPDNAKEWIKWSMESRKEERDQAAFELDKKIKLQEIKEGGKKPNQQKAGVTYIEGLGEVPVTFNPDPNAEFPYTYWDGEKNVPLPAGATVRTGTVEGKDIPASADVKLKQSAGAIMNLTDTIGDMIKLGDKEGDINTIVGATASFGTDLLAETRAIANQIGLDQDFLKVENYEDTFVELGIKNAQMKSLIVSAAMQKALSKPGASAAKMTDKDYANAIKEIGADAQSWPKFRQVLSDVSRRSVREFGNNWQALKGKPYEGLNALNEKLDKTFSQDEKPIEEITDEDELNSVIDNLKKKLEALEAQQ